MELNGRQTAYLLALYRLDQEAETNNRRASLRGEGKPAAQWRWIEYGPNGLPEILNYDPPLRHELQRQKLVDQGAGSTWATLANRKLVLLRKENVQVGPVVAPTLFVQLTRAGRALARNLSGTTTRSKKDELSVGAWRILAFAYQQSPKKVWTYDVWHKSNLFPPLPLVTAGLAKKLLRLGLVAGTWDSLAITDAGKLFYKTQFDHYSRLYPRIKAVKPEEETV